MVAKSMTFLIALCLLVSMILALTILLKLDKKDTPTADSRKASSLALMILSGFSLFLCLIALLMSLKYKGLRNSFGLLTLQSLFLMLCGVLVYKEYSDMAVKAFGAIGLIMAFPYVIVMFYLISNLNS